MSSGSLAMKIRRVKISSESELPENAAETPGKLKWSRDYFHFSRLFWDIFQIYLGKNCLKFWNRIFVEF